MKPLRSTLMALAATAILSASADAATLSLFRKHSSQPTPASDSSALRATQDENLAEDRNRQDELRSHHKTMSKSSGTRSISTSESAR